MKFVCRFLFLIPILAACDLQPRIVSLPDSVGDFIAARYPALLADPETQPEIYNSAATDYGVYASPELYGSVGTDDYILYASVDDYVLIPSPDAPTPTADTGAPIVAENTAPAPDTPTDDYLTVPMYGTVQVPTAVGDTVTVGRGDTLYAISRRTGVSVDELARLNNLRAPYTLRVGQALTIRNASVKTATETVAPKASVPAAAPDAMPARQTTTMVELKTITVGAGDTLYSLSRKYAVPVNDLAVMNNLAAPFTLHVGQRLKVPNLDDVAVRTAATTSGKQGDAKTTTITTTTTAKNAAPRAKTTTSSAVAATAPASGTQKPIPLTSFPA